MITVVRFTLAIKPAANHRPESVVQDVVGSLYNACTGVRTADVAHNASGLPPFRLGAVTVADGGARATAAVTVLDDGCLARVLGMHGRPLNPSVTVADVRVTAATTWARLLELGARVGQPVELLHVSPLSFMHRGIVACAPDAGALLHSARHTWRVFSDTELPWVPEDNAYVIEVDGRVETREATPEVSLRGFVGRAAYQMAPAPPQAMAAAGALFLAARWVGVGRRVAWGGGRVEPGDANRALGVAANLVVAPASTEAPARRPRL